MHCWSCILGMQLFFGILVDSYEDHIHQLQIFCFWWKLRDPFLFLLVLHFFSTYIRLLLKVRSKEPEWQFSTTFFSKTGFQEEDLWKIFLLWQLLRYRKVKKCSCLILWPAIWEWLKTSSFQWQSSHWPLRSPSPCCMSVDGAAICLNVHAFLSIFTIFVATEISSVSVSFQLELSCFVGLNSTATWKQKVIFETEPQESQGFGCPCRSFAQALYTWNVFLRKEELVLIACNMGLWLIKVVLSVMI